MMRNNWSSLFGQILGDIILKNLMRVGVACETDRTKSANKCNLIESQCISILLPFMESMQKLAAHLRYLAKIQIKGCHSWTGALGYCLLLI